MTFTRPVNSNALSKEKKLALLKDYVSHYEQEAALDSTTLNRKVPRETFSELLDRIGSLLLQESRRMATEPGAVYEFLTPLHSLQAWRVCCPETSECIASH
jgi:hypothetical protein